jgi:hypothetical protein
MNTNVLSLRCEKATKSLTPALCAFPTHDRETNDISVELDQL